MTLTTPHSTHCMWRRSHTDCCRTRPHRDHSCLPDAVCPAQDEVSADHCRQDHCSPAHREITVACQTRCVRLKMRCQQTIAARTIALLHIALTRVLHNEAVRRILACTSIAAVLTHTVREP